jgi:hypothetical protein
MTDRRAVRMARAFDPDVTKLIETKHGIGYMMKAEP